MYQSVFAYKLYTVATIVDKIQDILQHGWWGRGGGRTMCARVLESLLSPTQHPKYWVEDA